MKFNYSKITSISNPLIKEAVKIKKRINKQGGLLLIEGVHLLESAALSPLAEVKNVFFTDIFLSTRETSMALERIPNAKKVIVSEQILSLLTDTESPQGIAAIVDYRPFDLKQVKPSNMPLLVVCDAVKDPGNIGTIIRAADAFGADAVVILPLSCDQFNPKSVRATSGSLFNIPVIGAYQDELLNYLQLKNIALYAASVNAANSIYETDFRIPLAIAFGNEISGVSDVLQKRAAVSFRIPITGRAESLNVAMAASVILYEIAKQRGFFKI